MVRVIVPDGDREETDRPYEPLAMARVIHEKLMEDDPDRVIFREEQIGSVEVEKIGADFYKLKFGLHESNVENEFEFMPARDAREGGTTLQGTPLEQMGGKAGELASILKDALDTLPFEFAELDAASMGHENLTSYEFEYETSFRRSDLENATFE